MGRPFEKTPIFEGRSIDPLLFSPLLFLITNEKNDFPGEIRKNPSKILPIPSIENVKISRREREIERERSGSSKAKAEGE